MNEEEKQALEMLIPLYVYEDDPYAIGERVVTINDVRRRLESYQDNKIDLLDVIGVSGGKLISVERYQQMRALAVALKNGDEPSESTKKLAEAIGLSITGKGTRNSEKTVEEENCISHQNRLMMWRAWMVSDFGCDETMTDSEMRTELMKRMGHSNYSEAMKKLDEWYNYDFDKGAQSKREGEKEYMAQSITKTMEDGDFLQWIHDRLRHVHQEEENVDYMIRLRGIIARLEHNQQHLHAWREWARNKTTVWQSSSDSGLMKEIDELMKGGLPSEEDANALNSLRQLSVKSHIGGICEALKAKTAVVLADPDAKAVEMLTRDYPGVVIAGNNNESAAYAAHAKVNPEWLKKAVEEEKDQVISVGGLPTKMKSPEPAWNKGYEEVWSNYERMNTYPTIAIEEMVKNGWVKWLPGTEAREEEYILTEQGRQARKQYNNSKPKWSHDFEDQWYRQVCQSDCYDITIIDRMYDCGFYKAGEDKVHTLTKAAIAARTEWLGGMWMDTSPLGSAKLNPSSKAYKRREVLLTMCKTDIPSLIHRHWSELPKDVQARIRSAQAALNIAPEDRVW